ncbi:hypothetical protein V9T40_007927 [Parthenolecanium corni]|uniref:Uncharacterized protein n=1 Tax=Parthenolecanium corni TaxID=536013 RepID=A0AAN9TQL3_9HEMI
MFVRVSAMTHQRIDVREYGRRVGHWPVKLRTAPFSMRAKVGAEGCGVAYFNRENDKNALSDLALAIGNNGNAVAVRVTTH